MSPKNYLYEVILCLLWGPRYKNLLMSWRRAMIILVLTQAWLPWLQPPHLPSEPQWRRPLPLPAQHAGRAGEESEAHREGEGGECEGPAGPQGGQGEHQDPRTFHTHRGGEKYFKWENVFKEKIFQAGAGLRLECLVTHKHLQHPAFITWSVSVVRSLLPPYQTNNLPIQARHKTWREFNSYKKQGPKGAYSCERKV